MPFTWMAPSVRSRRASADRRARAQLHRRRFALEQFEDRTLLSNWIGALNSDWSEAGNWDAGVPSATNPAVIAGPVTVNINVATASARSLTLSGGATLNLNGNALAVNTAMNAVANGLTMTDAGTTLSGGINGTLSVGGNFTVDAASSFNVDDVTFKGVNTGTVDSAIAFKNVTIAYGGHHFKVAAGKPLDVNGALTITGYNTITGDINASGSVATSAPWSSNSSPNGYLILDGSGPQTLDGNGGVGNLPKVVNAKTGNSKLTLTGTITPVNWTQTSGQLAAAGSTTVFRSGYTNIDTGSTSLGNVTVDIGSNHLWVKQLNVGGDFLIQSAQSFQRVNGAPPTGELTVAGNLESLDSSVAGPVAITMIGGDGKTITAAPGDFPNGGIVIAKGGNNVTANVTTPLDGPLNIASVGYFGGSLAVGRNVNVNAALIPWNGGKLVFGGGANQNVTITGAGRLPGVVIDKTGGTLAIPAAVDVAGNWKYKQGTINTAGTTIRFIGGDKSVDTTGDSGDMTFNNVEIAIGGNSLNASNPAPNMIVGGKLTLTSVNYVGGVITVLGDVDTSAAVASSIRGGKILFTGNGVQTLTATPTAGNVPGVEINKTGGSLTLATDNPIGVTGGWKYVKGTVNAGGSTVNFIGGDKTVDSGASPRMTFGNVGIAIGGNSLTATNLAVGGNLTINSAAGIYAASGKITVAGDLTSNDSAVGGTADITLVPGGNNVDINKDTDGLGDFPNGGIIINKGLSWGVTANVLRPLDGPLDIRNANALKGTLAVGKNVATSAVANGPGKIVFMGGADQTLTATGSAGLPGVEINKTGGTLKLPAAVNVNGSWIVDVNNLGLVNTNGGTVKLTGAATVDTGSGAGAMTFNDVNVAVGLSKTLTVVNMVVDGALTLSSAQSIADGMITARGDVTASATGAVSSNGGGILFAGGGDQTFKASAANVQVPAVKIAKSGGLLTIDGANTINVTGDWTYLGNGSDVDASASTIRFVSVGGNKRVQSGAMKFGNVIVDIGSHTMSIVDANDQAVDALYTGTYNKQSGTIIKGQFKLFP